MSLMFVFKSVERVIITFLLIQYNTKITYTGISTTLPITSAKWSHSAASVFWPRGIQMSEGKALTWYWGGLVWGRTGVAKIPLILILLLI